MSKLISINLSYDVLQIFPTVNRSCKLQCMRKLKQQVEKCSSKSNGVQCEENCLCGTRSKPCKNKVCAYSGDNKD